MFKSTDASLAPTSRRISLMRSTRRSLSLVAIAAGLLMTGAAQAEKFTGIGRTATPAEIKAWDIDVRPDFKGLPPGKGSVSLGQDVWDNKCASCHGTFGESTEVHTPILGGTTKEDIKTGRVANLSRPDYPQRSAIMKVPTISTLWDYVNRAMPWTAPKSLTVEEVYGVVAYMMNMIDVVPDDFVLSDKNIAEVQAKMPNRNGMHQNHGLWLVSGKPDVKNTACMKNCATELTVGSQLPDYAKTAHGNLAEQNRPVGQVRGVNSDPSAAKAAAAAPKAAGPGDLVKSNNCTACHAQNSKLVGPSWAEIAGKYKGDGAAADKLAAKIKAGGAGVWGQIPMPGHPQISDTDLKSMSQWVLGGGK